MFNIVNSTNDNIFHQIGDFEKKMTKNRKNREPTNFNVFFRRAIVYAVNVYGMEIILRISWFSLRFFYLVVSCKLRALRLRQLIGLMPNFNFPNEDTGSRSFTGYHDPVTRCMGWGRSTTDWGQPYNCYLYYSTCSVFLSSRVGVVLQGREGLAYGSLAITTWA